MEEIKIRTQVLRILNETTEVSTTSKSSAATAQKTDITILIIETLRGAGVSVEIHDYYFAQAAQDIDWIPEVGQRGWTILTKDARISQNQLERLA
jgi:hypothetical protein